MPTTIVTSKPTANGDHGQHLPGGLAQNAGLPHTGSNLPWAGTSSGGDRADGQLLGQAKSALANCGAIRPWHK